MNTTPNQSESDPVERMLLRLVGNDQVHFKHQSRDEAPLTDADKLAIARDLYTRKPGVFLERFGPFLSWSEDRDNFVHIHDTEDVVGFFLDKYDRELLDDAQKAATHVVRNRRINALHRLESGQETDNLCSDHFSHEAMRRRDPILWEAMIGRHLDDTKRRTYLGRDYTTFSGFLLGQLVQREESKDFMAAKRKQDLEFKKRHLGKQAETSEADSSDMSERFPLEVMEREFLEMMKLRFVSGDDDNFDYSQIDNNDNLDDDVQRQLDEEERYFDAD